MDLAIKTVVKAAIEARKCEKIALLLQLDIKGAYA
jgi:hypothetical protein